MNTDDRPPPAPAEASPSTPPELGGVAGSPRTFPIQGQWHRKKHKWVPDSTIPWALIAPHEKQALENHCDQSLATLARRGGCSHDEAVAIIENRKWHAMDFQSAIDRLAELVREHEANNTLSNSGD